MLSAASSAMLPMLGTAVASSSSLLPATHHALQLFIRSGSFMSLTAPTPVRKQQQDAKQAPCVDGQDVPVSTAFTWTFAPLARELTRTAGGFEHRARWPLTNGSTLLDAQRGSSAASRNSSVAYVFASTYARRFSTLPHSSQPVQPQQCQEYTSSAAAIELPEATAATPGVLAAWFPKAQPRLKGFSRKLLLRQVNRKIIARVARRFTIGIPVLGFYFVSKLMVKDFARVKSEMAAGQYTVAALFSTALVADVFDLAAQITIISGLAHANLGMGLASAAALLVAADHASLATAALSFSCGLGGELLALKRAAELSAGSSSD